MQLRRCFVMLAMPFAGPTACQSSQAPVPPPRFVWVDPAGRLAAWRPMADSLVAQLARQVEQRIDVRGVVVTIADDPRQSIGGYGLGGRTFSARDVRLFVDPGFPGVDSLWPRRLTWLVAHELHHAARWRTVGYGGTLLEAMISEGMADRFAEEQLGGPLPPWATALHEDSTAHYLARARPEFDSRTYSHAAWFFDTDATLPRWTGYTLGYRLVVAQLSVSPGTTAASLVDAPASRFRP